MTMMINGFGLNTGDPYWSSVTLLMGFDGAIVDEKAGLTVTPGFSPTIVTSPPQPYGSGWVRFLVSGQQSFTVTETSDQFWFAGDFTIEFTIQMISFDTSFQRGILDQYNNNTANRSWTVYADGIGGVNKFSLLISADGINVVTIGTITTDDLGAALTTGVTYRIGIERFGNTWRFYVNGKTVTIVTSSTGFFNSNMPLLVGGHYLSGADQFLNAYIDELRITNGVARYRGDYTVSSTKFPRH